MKKTAIIIGSSGQDGTILFDYLSAKKYNVLGIDKDGVRAHGLKWRKKINIMNARDVFDSIKKIQPALVYHLAAYHHSAQDSFKDDVELLQKSYETHVFSLGNFLEAIRLHSPKTRLFYAASSLIFGTSASGMQNEKSPYNPDTFYGLSKLDGMLMCKMYREKYGIFASVGIFFNHESAYRQKKFLSRKVIQGAIDIKNQTQKKLEIGNLKAEVDWGYAPDYMDAAYKILCAKSSDDFVVATGKKHSVKDMVETAFDYLDLDWKQYVKEDKKIITRKRKAVLGDARKLRRVTGWKPTVSFEEMIIRIISELQS